MKLERVRVKICGITNREDAESAIALGADALGFNLFPGSKRYIQLEREAAWIAKLPPFVTRVAVLVNATLDEAREVAAHPAIDSVQFHGDEDEAYCAEFARTGRPFIKALRLKDESVVEAMAGFSTPHLLLDAYAGAAYGGTGTPIDLALAAEAVRRKPELNILLAGGLTPKNVQTAVRTVEPYGVDIASGVERDGDPRHKDAEKISWFIGEVEAGCPKARSL